jgi:hypothetical protein
MHIPSYTLLGEGFEGAKSAYIGGAGGGGRGGTSVVGIPVSVVSRYMHDPRTGHTELVYKILRCLKGTPGRGLWFKKNMHLDLEGYCDADVASSMDDRRSTSDYYCVLVGGNLVS